LANRENFANNRMKENSTTLSFIVWLRIYAYHYLCGVRKGSILLVDFFESPVIQGLERN
jgi:hypothetical protein